jgi:SlyX protein
MGTNFTGSPAMTGTIEQIEIKIAFLEQANAELSDVVYRQQQELDALRLQIAETVARFAQAQSGVTPYTAEEEKPPHY